MKISEVTSCFGGKLKLESRDLRHTDFRVRCASGVVGLPTLLRVSRGSGDIANNNLKHLAQGLGLCEMDFRRMVNCHIGRACVLLCLAAMLLHFVKRKYEEQGEVFRPGMLAMLESLELILNEPEFPWRTDWRPDERRALDRARSMTNQIIGDRDLGALAARLVGRMEGM